MTKIIDIHAHLWLGQEEENLQNLRRAAEKYHIDQILISALGSHAPSPAEIGQLNQAALGLRDPLFRSYITVAPEHLNSLDVLKRGLDQGAIGMKLWVSCLCDEVCCDPLYDCCAQAGIPVLIHAFKKTVGQLPGESTALELRRAALRHPNTNFILAHLGGNCYHGIPLIRDLSNVYADFSGSGSRADDLPYALEQLGASRILFGSDMPGSFVMSWGQLLSAALSEQEMRLICCENAQRLFRHLR